MRFVLKFLVLIMMFSFFVTCSTVEKKEEPKVVEPVIEVVEVVPEPVDPCDPNPCRDKHRSVCTADKEKFTCSCDDGFKDIGGICTNKKVLVLSVGAEKGFAHIGAIKAFNEAGIKFEGVFGNSMGSLMGSLYAIAPNQDIASRYRKLINSVVHSSVVSKVKALLYGLKNDVFRQKFDDLNNSIKIEETTIPFATSFFKIKDGRIGLKVLESGNLAYAVAGSINNPLIFSEPINTIENLDPGFDRVSATPVEDACRLFGPAEIYAVNVTGDEIMHTPKMNCPVIEIKVPVSTDVDPEKALMGVDPDMKILILRGYNAAKKVLEK